MTVPLIKLESSEAKNNATLAISSDSPARGFKLIPAIAFAMPNSLGTVIVAPIFVLTAPGAIPYTLG